MKIPPPRRINANERNSKHPTERSQHHSFVASRPDFIDRDRLPVQFIDDHSGGTNALFHVILEFDLIVQSSDFVGYLATMVILGGYSLEEQVSRTNKRRRREFMNSLSSTMAKITSSRPPLAFGEVDLIQKILNMHLPLVIRATMVNHSAES